MPAKAPIYLKATSSKKGKKCRLRDILSPDMISPPLGDFRHTIHIGKGGEGDAFGDMSFLQGRYELLPGKGDVLPHYDIQSDFLRADSAGDASLVETPSPVLKNAISLPTIGGCQALTLPLMPSSVFSMPPEPMADITRATAHMKAAGPEEVDILLLHSMDVFSGEPSSSADLQSRPDVLLDLLESTDMSNPRAISKANKMYKCEARLDEPLSYCVNGHNKGAMETNGSLTSNSSSDSWNSWNGKGPLRNNSCSSRPLRGHGLLNGELAVGFKRQLAMCSGEWVDRDRDQGVQEGRSCHFQASFSKEKSRCQDSLAQITGSFLSLELDLGPSILDEVLNIMDKTAVKSWP
ncbi:cdc42 effector protein 3 [Brachionichthys hirsutus]|uniref:cdc42 effector protein 3 n=1 Tax=Brachionichthys hirsutus TaxID=412623 RepID=UPI003604920F